MGNKRNKNIHETMRQIIKRSHQRKGQPKKNQIYKTYKKYQNKIVDPLKVSKQTFTIRNILKKIKKIVKFFRMAFMRLYIQRKRKKPSSHHHC